MASEKMPFVHALWVNSFFSYPEDEGCCAAADSTVTAKAAPTRIEIDLCMGSLLRAGTRGSWFLEDDWRSKCRAAEQRDERAPLHSIISSARARSPARRIPSAFAVLKVKSSLPQAVHPLGKHSHSVKAFPCRDVKRLLIRACKCGVGRLTSGLDGPEILTLGVKHLHACERGDVDTVIAVDRYAICAAFRAR